MQWNGVLTSCGGCDLCWTLVKSLPPPGTVPLIEVPQFFTAEILFDQRSSFYLRYIHVGSLRCIVTFNRSSPLAFDRMTYTSINIDDECKV